MRFELKIIYTRRQIFPDWGGGGRENNKHLKQTYGMQIYQDNSKNVIFGMKIHVIHDKHIFYSQNSEK